MNQVPDDLLHSFELKAMEQAERAQLLSRRIEQNVATVESPGGEVRLTVDSSGGLAGLNFGSAAERLPLERLGELVLRTSRQAQARLAESMNDLISDVYGRDSETARFVARTYAERFPESQDDEGSGRP
ncbi:YbaB/EbfC family nucleoid-associated protein [Winogradskya humida]|uniref:YbaB/EbfC DNA-binding family protein n=1 Tax=Winogradskya humida TaxID=113566 RepID=A0ABQ3ZGG2_9ACTN|nr:YbaB/EbfC family nucleoid-associated protein [Actinoplanes humidus]GIE17660.1 hypothetical protein Ahu01nite_007620 [Actinoplanes humidus]